MYTVKGRGPWRGRHGWSHLDRNCRACLRFRINSFPHPFYLTLPPPSPISLPPQVSLAAKDGCSTEVKTMVLARSPDEAPIVTLPLKRGNAAGEPAQRRAATRPAARTPPHCATAWPTAGARRPGPGGVAARRWRVGRRPERGNAASEPVPRRAGRRAPPAPPPAMSLSMVYSRRFLHPQLAFCLPSRARQSRQLQAQGFNEPRFEKRRRRRRRRRGFICI